MVKNSNQISRIYVLLLGLNSCFFCINLYFFTKKGGATYFVNKFLPADNYKIKHSEHKDNKSLSVFLPGHLDRVKLFNQFPKKQKSIVFLGDSITQAFVMELSWQYVEGMMDKEWDRLFRERMITNRGVGGDTTSGVLARTSEITKLKPSKIFIMAGINDLAIGRRISDILLTHRKILELIRFQSSETKIFIQSILPTNDTVKNHDIVTLNLGLKSLCSEFKVTYLDLYPLMLGSNNQLNLDYTYDGTHLYGKGFTVWKNTITSLVTTKN